MITPMKNVPQTVQTTYQQIKQQQNTRLELRNIKNHYYIYKAQNHYNKQTKQSQKTTQLIGKITPDGQYHPKQTKQQTVKISATKTYQYASSELLLQLSKDLQQATKNLPYKDELLALSITKAIHPTPIRLTQTAWNDLYASTKIPANLTQKNITKTLTTIGENIQKICNLFHNLTPDGGMLFYDLTSILSQSKRLLLAERGYNPDWEQRGQIKVALAFSTTSFLPVAVDVFYGSLKEVKVLKYFKEHYQGSDLGFIMDRGFNSYELLLELKKQGIHYIAPLMKNPKFLPPAITLEGVFEYGKKKKKTGKGRMIAFGKVCCGEYGFLYLFKDPGLGRLVEEHLLGLVFRQKLSMEEYEFEGKLAGVFGILSDLDVEPKVVFEQYKAREEIEQVFDYMKNDLEADHTCLGNDEAVRGFFVVVFLAMRLYFKILQRLREKGLVGMVSVREVLFELSKMRMIVETNGKEHLCVLSKKAEQILEVFSDLVKTSWG